MPALELTRRGGPQAVRRNARATQFDKRLHRFSRASVWSGHALASGRFRLPSHAKPTNKRPARHARAALGNSDAHIAGRSCRARGGRQGG
jgi:hypothetical protein